MLGGGAVEAATPRGGPGEHRRARDARHLAQLLHLGEIVAVAVPSAEREAARDVMRAREDARKDLTSARHRVSKLWLRHGIVYYGRRPWTRTHDEWLRSRRLAQPSTQLAFETAYNAMLAAVGRRDRLERRSRRWPPAASTRRW